MSKHYLSFDEQIKHLNDDKKILCNGDQDKELIIRVGYFNLVNGYKTPFTSSKDMNGNHIYARGTTIKEFYALKKFDDKLRYHLLYYITRVEEEIRTISSYLFDKENTIKAKTWKSTKAYSKSVERPLLQKLISRMNEEIKLRRNSLEYVDFYLKNHSPLPTWVVTKAINLGTFINFLKYSPASLKKSFCTLYGLHEDGYFDETLMIGSLHWMRLIRNSCAHNERIYCISGQGRIVDRYIRKLGKRYWKNINRKIFDLLIYMKYYLMHDDYKKFINEIIEMMKDLENQVSAFAFQNIRGNMGIKKMEDLGWLRESEQYEKDYLKL